MKRKKTFGQIIITAMFIWSALLCHFEASTLREEGNVSSAILYWFFGLNLAVICAYNGHYWRSGAQLWPKTPPRRLLIRPRGLKMTLFAAPAAVRLRGPCIF